MRNFPDEIVHIDIMTSSAPGLIAQMIGFITSKRFHQYSFFVDDKSDYAFVHHQQSTSAEDTIIANKSHEAELKKY